MFRELQPFTGVGYKSLRYKNLGGKVYEFGGKGIKKN